MSSVDGLLKQINRPSSPHHCQGIIDSIGPSSVIGATREENQVLGDTKHLIAELTETHSDGKLFLNGTVKSALHPENNSSKNTNTVTTSSESNFYLNKLNLMNELEDNAGKIEENSHITPITKIQTILTHDLPETYHYSHKISTITPTLPEVSQSLTGESHSSQSIDSYEACVNNLPDVLMQDTPSLSTGLCPQPPISSSSSVHHTKMLYHQSHLPDAPTHFRNPTQTSSQLASLIGSSHLSNFGDQTRGSNSKHNSYRNKLSDVSTGQVDDLSNLSDTDSSSKSSSNPSDIEKSNSLTKSPDSSAVTEWLETCVSGKNSNPSHRESIASTTSEEALAAHESKGASSEVEKTDLTHLPYPDWKLDRRESGHLFWRRDSSQLNGVDPSSRVKFRYDVEVCEFETRNSEAEDLPEDDEESDDEDDESGDEYSTPLLGSTASQTCVLNEEPTSLTSTKIVFVILAITALIVALIYKWLKPSVPPK